uniref:(northern house mosquito) hypothetical protein n=1 Tax=Culex pipiens TaxID=7175 RepID=A0A8D8HMU6_CULPI
MRQIMRQHLQRCKTNTVTETTPLVLPVACMFRLRFLLHRKHEPLHLTPSSTRYPGHENTSSGRRNRKIQFKTNGIDPHDGRLETSAGNVSTAQLSCQPTKPKGPNETKKVAKSGAHDRRIVKMPKGRPAAAI